LLLFLFPFSRKRRGEANGGRSADPDCLSDFTDIEGDEDNWRVQGMVQDPDLGKQQRGKKTKRRYRSWLETMQLSRKQKLHARNTIAVEEGRKRAHTCKGCNQEGHNSKTCPKIHGLLATNRKDTVKGEGVGRETTLPVRKAEERKTWPRKSLRRRKGKRKQRRQRSRRRSTEQIRGQRRRLRK